MNQSSTYVAVPMAGAAPLTEARTAELAIYLPGQAGKDPILYRRAGEGVPQVDVTRLRESGLPYLLVRPEQVAKCEAILEARLEDVLSDPSTAPADKAELVHHVGTFVTRELISAPGQPVNLRRATAVVDSVISWVLDDLEASSHLLGMACHHRSTASHMFVVSVLAVLFGNKVIGSDPRTLREIGLAGLLHDLGKLGVDPNVLKKPGRLSPQERQHIQQHPVESVRLLDADAHASTAVRQMILQHHERVDGRGYPLGLSADELLPGSKLLSIVDSFHAIIGPRSYREQLSPEDANRALAAQADRQFDAAMLASWQELFSEHWQEGTFVLCPEQVEAECSETEKRHEVAPSSGNTILQARRPRVPCNGKLKALCVYSGRLKNTSSAPDAFSALLHDLSCSGMCINVPYPMYRGEVVNAQLRANGQTMWLNAVVAWCHAEGGAGQYKVGIRFIERISEARIHEKTSPKPLNDPHVDPLAGLSTTASSSLPDITSK